MMKTPRWYDSVLDWVNRRSGLLIIIALLIAIADLILLWKLVSQTRTALPTAVAPSPSATIQTPTPTATWTSAAQPTATQSTEPAATQSPEPTTTQSAEPTTTQSAEPTATQSAEPTATRIVEPAATPTQIEERTATPIASPTDTPTPLALPTPTPTPVIVDWYGEYYADANLMGAVAMVRNDQAIDFEWEYDAPAEELPADEFSVRWTRVLAFEEGLYRFHTVVDDGVRLYVDGELIVDDWQDGAQRETSAEFELSAGRHTLRVEYYDRYGVALVHLWWEKLKLEEWAYPDWKGEYWSNRDLEGEPMWVRNDPDVDFDWQRGSPDQSIPNDNFGARWTRKARFGAGTYRFHAMADDGVRLWVDDQLIIDAWYDHAALEWTTDHALVEGEHTVQVEYYEHVGTAEISVWWEKVVYASYPDWKGEYWPNRSLSGNPALVRNDPTIDFNWKEEGPAFGLPTDSFAARWTREVQFEAATYRFHALVDDGVRVWVDDRLLIDAWYDHSVHEVTAKRTIAYGTHEIRVEYYEHLGSARIRVWWEFDRNSR
jgi:hypothetical protein